MKLSRIFCLLIVFLAGGNSHATTPSTELTAAAHLCRTILPVDQQETADASLTTFMNKLKLLPPEQQNLAIAHASGLLASKHIQRSLKQRDTSTLQRTLEQLANHHLLRHLQKRSALPAVESRVWYNTLAHPLAIPPTEVRFDVFKMLIPVALLCSFFLIHDLLNNYSAGGFGLRECATFERRQRSHVECRKLIEALHKAACVDKSITSSNWWGKSLWRKS